MHKRPVAHVSGCCHVHWAARVSTVCDHKRSVQKTPFSGRQAHLGLCMALLPVHRSRHMSHVAVSAIHCVSRACMPFRVMTTCMPFVIDILPESLVWQIETVEAWTRAWANHAVSVFSMWKCAVTPSQKGETQEQQHARNLRLSI
jgi:hypothetical protein